MIIGTTPTHVFNIPIDTQTIKNLRITYAQNDSPILVKTFADCELLTNAIKVKLTQEDTFKFNIVKYVNNSIQVQLRVLTVDDDVIASKVMNISIEQCLDKEVLQ